MRRAELTYDVLEPVVRDRLKAVAEGGLAAQSSTLTSYILDLVDNILADEAKTRDASEKEQADWAERSRRSRNQWSKENP